MHPLPLCPLFANRWLIPLPPIWLLGMGGLAAVVALLTAYGIVRLVSRRAADEMRSSLNDGFLGPVAWLVFTFIALAIALTPVLLWNGSPSAIEQVFLSLVRFVRAGDGAIAVTIPAHAEQIEIPLDLRPQELASIELRGDASLVVRTQQPIEGFALAKVPDVELETGRPWTWSRTEGATSPFLGQRAELRATNPGDAPAQLDVRWSLVPEFPQAAILPWTFLVLTAIAAVYSLFRVVARRTAAVASATTKEAIGQPIFPVSIALGSVLLLLFIIIPYNTFGEDVKMLKESGLTLIKVLALLVVIWTASVAVSEEIEGRTALTVLSKPLARWQFVFGKFAGLVLVALLMFLILGGVLLATTSLKVVYDAREGARVDPLWRDCAEEMITVVPGLALSLLETILLAAVSLAVSTRLGMVPNLIVSFTVYALGHLVPLVVQSSVGKFAIVRFFGQLFATIFPVLEHFTIDAAVAGGVPVPWGYLGWAALYAGLYSAVALLVALILFQDRDLA